MLPFLKKFRKEISKLDNVNVEFSPPGKWSSTGNYALNRSLSGSYFKAIPQGRLTGFVGPSAAGKSYIVCNCIREAQKDGDHALVLDSENALDPQFMKRAGVNISDEALTYVQVVTIQDVTAVISEFFSNYDKEYGKNNKAGPGLFIVLDSLGNCLTDSENEKFEKGVQTGDQGQSAKNKKHLLRTLVSRLARYNATFVFTDQVYPQDPKLGDGLWAVTNGVKYSASLIALLTKLKLKEDAEVVGIMMRIENYKSRFVKPGTRIEVDIPFLTGLSSTAGLIEAWEVDGIITKEGFSWLVEVNGETIKFKKSALDDELALKILKGNTKIQAIEKSFSDLEETELFMPTAELPEKAESKGFLGSMVDPETGEILSLGNIEEKE